MESTTRCAPRRRASSALPADVVDSGRCSGTSPTTPPSSSCGSPPPRLVDEVDPADLWAVLIAPAGSRAQGAIVHTASHDDDPAEHERRRAAPAAPVRRAFCR
ncbi:hypothetical protein I4I73_23105 [Pseudonocardia sp. KRD-184]|uniref:Uncharacterized protein n=1 Tax=Pseudonocardia oceani TaxID=2792013 RepID=A0ABS6U457_9PSEU|nr:hypothetical protein [Pseudonocardia oceani]MBW0092590.1 hypothetical protein [Pseudonocardia oceani]MBW0098884.1 hypothetical protein [Pseudonocardia oceani]MBW0111402.1 hypothetical protein [Pseudonocardia oceani]MBW0123967.1 hypothetical protein [Pseudonocardia oceani]MBW0126776.1 hypothetical protein [Pseudonocardia oceani]